MLIQAETNIPRIQVQGVAMAAIFCHRAKMCTPSENCYLVGYTNSYQSSKRVLVARMRWDWWDCKELSKIYLLSYFLLSGNNVALNGDTLEFRLVQGTSPVKVRVRVD